MDTRAIIAEARAKFNHVASKRQLKEKYDSKLIVAEQEGLWKATPELIGFLSGLNVDEIVMIDLHDNPVHVNVKNLKDKLLETYISCTTSWHKEWSMLESKR
jgi:hypothetical protein